MKGIYDYGSINQEEKMAPLLRQIFTGKHEEFYTKHLNQIFTRPQISVQILSECLVTLYNRYLSIMPCGYQYGELGKDTGKL